MGSKFEVEVGYRLRMRCAHLLGADLETKKQIQKQITTSMECGRRSYIPEAYKSLDADLSAIRSLCQEFDRRSTNNDRIPHYEE